MDQTRTATYSFWAAMPLLVMYEVLILIANFGSETPVRVGADVWIKQVLALMGGAGHLILGVVVALIGLAVYWHERQNPLKLKPGFFAGMLGESMFYAIVIALAVSTITRYAFSAMQLQELPALGNGFQGSLLFNLALSLGAGLYEELVFRVALVGAFYLGLRALLGKKVVAYVLASVIGAALFSGVHHLGEFGDPFTVPVFFYRFVFGLFLQGLLVWRGYGIAAWTHALYDVFVVLTSPS